MISLDDLTELLSDTEEEHAQYEKKLGHKDNNWPEWYAEHLLEVAAFAKSAHSIDDPSDLASLLLKLNNNYLEEKPSENWAEYYADQILDLFS